MVMMDWCASIRSRTLFPSPQLPGREMKTSLVTVRSILTRTSGYLTTVCSHSIQPYRGCPFGASLCGVGCYVQHNIYATQGKPWGSFLDVRTNAADAYRSSFERERAWARKSR